MDLLRISKNVGNTVTSKTKDQIKAFFQLGDKPTESQFVDLIDSYLDKSGPLGTLEAAGSAASTGIVTMAAGVPAVTATAAFTGQLAYATTAQAAAGTATGLVMDPVLVKNAVGALGVGQVTLLATKTASTSASLDFTSLITSAYNEYILVISDLVTSTTCSIGMKFSKTNGSAYDRTPVAQMATLTLGGTTAPSYTGQTASTTPITASQAADKFSGKIYMTVSPTMQTTKSLLSSAALAGAWETTINEVESSLINAFQLLPSAGTFTSGTAYFYGIKNT